MVPICVLILPYLEYHMKVLVVGLRREQSDKLRKMYREMDINVLDDQALHHKPVKNAHEYDVIVSLTKFTNHTTHRNYKNHPGYRMTAGGYSSVATILSNLPS